MIVTRIRYNSICCHFALPVETHLAGSFDMKTARFAEGYFIGDYAGLDARATALLPFLVQTNSGNTGQSHRRVRVALNAQRPGKGAGASSGPYRGAR